MGTYSFKLPDLGEGIVESEISAWHVQPGDQVQEDQLIAEVMTDKAVVEITAPVTGTVVALAGKAGDVLKVGRELIRFEVQGPGNLSAESGLDPKLATEPEPEPEPESKPEPTVTITRSSGAFTNGTFANIKPPTSVTDNSVALPHRRVLTSPSLRRQAREANIDLSLVPGSGPEGRITQEDMDAYLSATRSPKNRKRHGSRSIHIQGLRRVIARKIQQSAQQIPHYSYIEEVDVTQLEALRRHLNDQRSGEQVKLTLLPFIMRALSRLLPDFPHCNAHYHGSKDLLVQHEPVNIGIATMTEAGLMVPVVRHCESLDLWQAAAEISRLSQSARSGKAGKDELSGSTISITSLGALGGIATTPIINAPETAIIGVNKIQERVIVKEGRFVIRKMMNLSSSFDHRIVDGFDGAQLVQKLKALLEHPGAAFV